LTYLRSSEFISNNDGISVDSGYDKEENELDFLERFKNLKVIIIRGSDISSALPPFFKDFHQLTTLNISQTDIKEGLENMPDSLLVLSCDPFLYEKDPNDESKMIVVGETEVKKI
jgi:hypothetical protein